MTRDHVVCCVAQTTGYRYADSLSHGELLLMDITHVATRFDLFGHHQATVCDPRMQTCTRHQAHNNSFGE